MPPQTFHPQVTSPSSDRFEEERISGHGEKRERSFHDTIQSAGATGRLTEAVLRGRFCGTDYGHTRSLSPGSALRGKMKERNGQAAQVMDLCRA